jgi:colanic acid/amylovoran biosynthesis glycosyltransferase
MANRKVPRVVLFAAAFPQRSETFIVSKFLGLLEQGWDVRIVCNQSDTAEWQHFPELGSRRIKQRIHKTWPISPHWLVPVLYPFAMVLAFLSNPAGFAGYLRRGVKRHGRLILKRSYLDLHFIRLKPHLIHFEFGTIAVGREDLGGLLDCREVVSFRGYDLNFAGLEQAEYYQGIWQHAAGLHFLGEDLRRRALRRGCPSDKPYVLIPPAIDVSFFDPGEKAILERVGTPERPYRILSVGRLEWKKGYEFGLQAVRMLVDHGVTCEYRIIGDGSHLEAVAFARHRLGLEPVVSLMGAKSRKEIQEQLKWADVFLHPAVSEGFSNAVLEAQAMTVPVVCTDADGLSENVLDGQTGFVVPRRHPARLADKLLELTDMKLRRRMGKSARQRVTENFCIDSQIQAFSQFYVDVLKEQTWLIMM